MCKSVRGFRHCFYGKEQCTDVLVRQQLAIVNLALASKIMGGGMDQKTYVRHTKVN